MLNDNNPKFVATQLIENIYLNKLYLNEDIFKKINFLEETTKFIYYKKDRIAITESLAQNIVHYLPINQYEKLITLDSWFHKYNSTNNPIYTALLYKKFDFINVILDKLEYKKKLNEQNNQEFNSKDRIFANLILEKIIFFPLKENLPALDYFKKDVDSSFFPIWNRSLDLLNDFQKYIYIGNINNNSPINFIDKLKNVRLDYTLLLSQSSKHSCMFPFFNKIMENINPEQKKEIKLKFSKLLLHNSFFSQNKKTINFLLKEKFFNSSLIVELIQEFNELIDFSKNTIKEKNVFLNSLSSFINLLSPEDLKKIQPFNLTGFAFLMKEDKNELIQLIQYFPQLLTSSLIPNANLNINKIKILEEIKEFIYNNNNIKYSLFNDNNIESSNTSYNIAKNLIPSLTEFISVEQLTPEFAEEIISSTDGFLNEFKSKIYQAIWKENSTSQEIITTFNKDLLSFVLSSKINSSQSKKHKI